ncbi:MAG TPA: PilT/PilU family type 4a pilus ATPase [Phycisphaerales bacterium]|nr:PilT/PilU family type 4a pilus ATPase [Phycisphaerales bacterium]HMP36543.1 PilT/PilU family type 4a pilus ATPase [Phycisphaerales bacterium]
MDLASLIGSAVDLKVGDLHLQSARPPMVRRSGELVPIEGAAPLTDEWIRETIRQIAPEDAQIKLNDEKSADFSFEMPGRSRFRVNAFYQQGRMAMAIRLVPIVIPKFEDLNLPSVIEEIADTPRGLVIVTGTTGSGKSTTLAAMIGHINEKRGHRIITIEDPIEFVHTSRKSLIAQRELGQDTPTFLAALRVALRQDPDVILLGELRDAETMRTALQAADTGHAVFSTMHTTNASQTLQRMIALFPPDERDLLLMQLAGNIEAVISQRLAKTTDGADRIPVVEIMRSTPVTRKMIREGTPKLLPQAIANGDAGMQLFDQHLAKLWQMEMISGTEALRLSTNPEAVAMIMKGLSTRDLAASLLGGN